MSDVLLPKNLHEVWNIFNKSPGALVYAGGTDLLVKFASSGTTRPSTETYSYASKTLKSCGVSVKQTEGSVSAHVSHTASLLSHPLIGSNFPLLPKGTSSSRFPSCPQYGNIRREYLHRLTGR